MILDELDRRPDSNKHSDIFSRRHFEEPYTREKYLQYFRPMEYGEASIARHGGNRRVDMQMAEDQMRMYQNKNAGNLKTADLSASDEVRWHLLHLTVFTSGTCSP
jgi:hypothetical protein